MADVARKLSNFYATVRLYSSNLESWGKNGWTNGMDVLIGRLVPWLLCGPMSGGGRRGPGARAAAGVAVADSADCVSRRREGGRALCTR